MGFPFPDVALGRLPWKGARARRGEPRRDAAGPALSRHTKTTPVSSRGGPAALSCGDSPLGRGRHSSSGLQGAPLAAPSQRRARSDREGTGGGAEVRGGRGAAGPRRGPPQTGAPRGARERGRLPASLTGPTGGERVLRSLGGQAGRRGADGPRPVTAVGPVSSLTAGGREREDSPSPSQGAGGRERDRVPHRRQAGGSGTPFPHRGQAGRSGAIARVPHGAGGKERDRVPDGGGG